MLTLYINMILYGIIDFSMNVNTVNLPHNKFIFILSILNTFDPHSQYSVEISTVYAYS